MENTHSFSNYKIENISIQNILKILNYTEGILLFLKIRNSNMKLIDDLIKNYIYSDPKVMLAMKYAEKFKFDKDEIKNIILNENKIKDVIGPNLIEIFTCPKFINSLKEISLELDNKEIETIYKNLALINTPIYIENMFVKILDSSQKMKSY